MQHPTAVPVPPVKQGCCLPSRRRRRQGGDIVKAMCMCQVEMVDNLCMDMVSFEWRVTCLLPNMLLCSIECVYNTHI